MTLQREPEGWEPLEHTISNFDGGKVADGIEERLRAGGCYAEHPAWDHWGAIWFADGQFHERVMQYRAHVATVSNDNLTELVRKVNDTYGWE